MNIIYDTEVFPNCYLFCAIDADTGDKVSFEISDYRDDWVELRLFMQQVKLSSQNSSTIGFNNLAFDYPILHAVLNSRPNPKAIYEMAQAIISADNAWTFTVRLSDCWASQIDLYRIPQIDLYRIHHFDNKARMTSLKALEFNMRLDNIEDLPFPVGTRLTREQIGVVRDYCWNDVSATVEFYKHSVEKINFRRKLTEKYGFSFSNFSDVKIGKEIFRLSLEAAGVECYIKDQNGRQPKQTLRTNIALKDCIPDYVRFFSSGFKSVLENIRATRIVQTKGAFDLAVPLDGLEYRFGTGGIHASVENQSFIADEQSMILDVDVTSLYPSIAIENRYYPKHLGPKFVEVYRSLREQRMRYPKGTPENDMLKLALNGVYGASNDPYSIFYDSLFTMQITITGQLIIAMLVESLLTVPSLKIIQANTDGITMKFDRDEQWLVNSLCEDWEKTTRLSLEKVEYERIHIADVNSYIARTVGGKVKRKGRYEHNVEWHQNASALVVPKVAEKVLLDGVPIKETVENWPDKMDFMCRVKVPRSSRLVIGYGWAELPLENMQRYYVSRKGGQLVKIMPPLPKNPDHERRIGVCSGYNVCPCNKIGDAVFPVDFDWYIKEVEKLVLPLL
jgi:hypothetical protein